jgi:Putative zinc-finger
MVGRVINFDSAAHRSAMSLLPWWVNGTLQGEEMVAVERHLRDCPRCQREVEWLRELQQACADNDTTQEAAHAFQALQQKLGATERSPGIEAALPARSGARGRTRSWLPWAVAIQFVLILVLGSWLFSTRPPLATYRTLGVSDTRSMVGNVVIKFAPRTPVAELRRILLDGGAQIVAGPSEEGAYVLHVSSSRQDAVLQALRAESAVMLVEPLGPGNDR